MADDLYQDFVFAALTADIVAGTTVLDVDDVTQLPTNTALAGGDFWLVLSSALIHPPTFEITKLTAVDSGASQVTVVRGQDGTSAQSHPTGTLVKGALTAAMLGRLRRSRGVVTATSSSLAAGASDAVTTIALGRAFRLYSIQTSRPARVELYATAAARTADAGRTGIDPAADAGVILDYVTTNTSAHTLSPMVDGANQETTPTAAIAMRVTNRDTATGTVVVTLVSLRTE